tara:strand:+ start:399 stop:842 length:444 start_codon:yes stop_codon:yes gene_type:complete
MKFKQNNLILSFLIIELIIRIIYFYLTFPEMMNTITKWDKLLKNKKNSIKCYDKNKKYTENTCIEPQIGYHLQKSIELQIGGIVFTLLSIINPIWLILNILFKLLLLTKFISFINININKLFLLFNSFNIISSIFYINYLNKCLTTN